VTTPRTRSNAGLADSAFTFSRAVRAGDHIAVALTQPSWADGSWNADPEAQARRCLELIVEALKEMGAGPNDITRTWVWQLHPSQADAVARAHAAVLRAVRPAITHTIVSGFSDPRSLVAIEAEAVIGAQRQRISLNSYPGNQALEASLGWSRAFKVGGRVHVSCTAPVGPEGLDGAYDQSAEVQAQRCIDVVEQALKQAGADLDHVIATRVWVRDQRDSAATGRVHHKAFGAGKPAFTQLVLPQFMRPEWRVEIEVEADTGGDRQSSMYNNAADSPWSRGVRVGNRVVVATSGPRWDDGSIDPDPGKQAERVWEIILATLKETGAGPEHVTRARIYVRHHADFDAVAKFTQQAFGESLPALAVIAIHGFNRAEWRVEIEAEAII